MKIALIGGTGAMGTGLAARWAGPHQVMIGSRDYERAKTACDEIRDIIPDPKAKTNVDPFENYHAIQKSEVVIPCIGYEHAIPTMRDLIAGFKDQILISPLTPMMGSEGNFQYIRPKQGSAAMQLASILPEKVSVVSCFQGLPASKLADVNRTINFDIPVFTDSSGARKKVFDLIRDIRYLKPLYGGPLELAYLGEMMGVLWRNLGYLNRLRDPSFKFPE
jgi:NADPH-dependent F420 reductase